ncbi:MAG: hypothetical protein AAFV53_36045 [Myxococcota bacterium]
MPPIQEIDVPPTIGGTGLGAAAGLLAGLNVTATFIHGARLEGVAWLLPLGLLLFVVALLISMQLTRRQLNMRASPRTLRRQWLVVLGGVVVGFIVGVAMGASGVNAPPG